MQRHHQGARLIAGADEFRDDRPSLFSLAVALVAIATALLCALMPLNLPSVSVAGSAFNPANSAVTLGGPASSRAAIKRLVQGDDADINTPLIGHDAVAATAAAFDAPFAAHRGRASEGAGRTACRDGRA